jgi:tetratricopeptide (TPR) repeat protein
MRIAHFALSLLLASSLAQATEYGHYDSKRILAVSETPSGKTYGIEVKYLDQMLNDLGFHAKNYPPQFDTPQDKQRAIQDITMLSGMLDILVNGPNPNPEVLLRAGFLNSLGFNLDIPGSAEKTTSIFQKLFAISPSEPRANYIYGTFLASTTRFKEAIPYLKTALAAGAKDADYALGMTYLALGDKKKALENLEAYRQRSPNDGSIIRLVDALRSGTLEIKKNPN